MKTAIFLGAGASKAEGAPMQNELFREYFKSVKSVPEITVAPNSPISIKGELAKFFQLMFGINIEADDKTLAKTDFPTFEEVLGILDLAEIRRESLRKFPLDALGAHGNRIRLLRQFIVLAMAKVIADNLETSKRLHRTLVEKLTSPSHAVRE